MKKTKASALTKALLETADDMREAGILDRKAHEKITMRHLGSKRITRSRLPRDAGGRSKR
jgi:hypothetical protein